MTRAEAQTILALYRERIDDPRDPLFAEALALAARDPELGRWLAEEQNLDRKIAEQWDRAMPECRPPKNFLMAHDVPASRPGEPVWQFFKWFGWGVPLVMLGISIFLFLQASHDPGALQDFRSEMVGFIRVPPSLELKTHDLAKIEDWARTAGGVSSIAIPTNTQSQLPIGCRTLVFRSQTVALVCFLRKDHQFVHLLAINTATFKHLSLGRPPEFVQEGEWMTATWVEGNTVYMLATKGGREDLAKYL